MGALAEAVVNYAQTLLDQTDGSEEQLNKAFAISQLCFNLALLPEDRQEETLSELRPSLEMGDEEFDSFRRTIVVPMIRRHKEMFPRMHQHGLTGGPQSGLSSSAHPKITTPEKYPGTDRYAQCPCNSGRKYKFCCWARGR